MLHSSLKVLRPIVASHVVMPPVVSANIHAMHKQFVRLCLRICPFNLFSHVTGTRVPPPRAYFICSFSKEILLMSYWVVPVVDCLGPFCAAFSIDLHVCYTLFAICSSYFLPIQWRNGVVLEQKIYTTEAQLVSGTFLKLIIFLLSSAGLKLIFGKKSKSSGVRMRLLSKLGKFLFAWFFIVSAIQTSFMFENQERVREDYAAKLSGVMDFLEHYLGLTSTGKINLICEFVMMFNILKISGALLFLCKELILNMCGTYMLMFCFLATPLVYDFYLYKVGDPEFPVLLHGFMQNMALCGALLFLQEMRWTIHQSQGKKRLPSPSPNPSS